jgi:FKBP-type peptidyl-prolyl cis-trans isomerase
MLSKFELVGISFSILCMAVALYLIRVETTIFTQANNIAQLATVKQTGVVVVNENGTNINRERTQALMDATDNRGNVKKLVIDDISVGTGVEAKSGDTVEVHYIGTLPNGTEFDNSNKRGAPFSFTIGEGRVIQGWEQGVVGMKVGGKRILVIPPELAYGDKGIGPIPPKSTLVFAIELLSVKE